MGMSMGTRDEMQTQANAIIAAARGYRDTMRHYLAERERVLDDRAVVDDLVTCLWTAFREAMRAEQELFALLDRLDAR
jgi:hypothetical protein